MMLSRSSGRRAEFELNRLGSDQNRSTNSIGTQVLNLKTNSFQEGEDDAYMKRENPTLERSITKGRLKRIQEERLYVPKSSIKDLLVKEADEGGLLGHFREHKTVETLSEHFY
ncbi:hypothetical protein CR513_13279, partial [Mucuna pruriens]